MPGGDGTGPMGLGPMTGRAAGYCAGYSTPGYMNAIPGRGGFGFAGFGRVRGGGRGRRNWYYATGMPGWARAAYGMPAFGGAVNPWGNYPYAQELTSGQETQMLKEQADILKQQLKDIQSRIATLEKAQKQEKGND